MSTIMKVDNFLTKYGAATAKILSQPKFVFVALFNIDTNIRQTFYAHIKNYYMFLRRSWLCNHEILCKLAN